MDGTVCSCGGFSREPLQILGAWVWLNDGALPPCVRSVTAPSSLSVTQPLRVEGLPRSLDAGRWGDPARVRTAGIASREHGAPATPRHGTRHTLLGQTDGCRCNDRICRIDRRDGSKSADRRELLGVGVLGKLLGAGGYGKKPYCNYSTAPRSAKVVRHPGGLRHRGSPKRTGRAGLGSRVGPRAPRLQRSACLPMRLPRLTRTTHLRHLHARTCSHLAAPVSTEA